MIKTHTINNRRSNKQEVSRNSVWKANGTRLALLFVPAEITESNGTYEKEVLFFQMEYFSNEHSCSFSSKSPLIPVSGLRGRCWVNRTDLYKWKMRFWNEIHRFAWPYFCSHAVLCVSFTDGQNTLD